ncbi:peptidoglycan hydrolase [Bacillus sp. BRMEA1]|uniref:glycosyl hydrolase family 18 protein n=1 Tax=Neobacillus endophyticus TaxID=2738405 RepID=UPI001563DD05|nr:glycosyl hydrolase family 18 protein [Neobacillus endophyticus]NRD79611.1 peptidoglycan hydrolase [Neobacillus endophyticus]
MVQIELSKKRRLSAKGIFFGLIAAFILVISAIFFLFYPFASTEKTVYFHGLNPIIYKGAQQGNALIEKNKVYIPLSFLKKDLDNSVIMDEQSKSIIITSNDKVVQLPLNSLKYYVNGKQKKIQQAPIITKDGDVFAELDLLLSIYPVQYKRLPESHAVWIQRAGEEYTNGTIAADSAKADWLRLRTSASVRTPYTAETSNHEPVFIEREKDGYYFVRKANGIGGYIKKDYVKTEDKVKINIAQTSVTYSLPKINGPLNLTWEAVYTKTPASSTLPVMPGINVVSPTWFSLASEKGAIKNKASLQYSKWAHQKGYQVWGAFSNSFDPGLTFQTLKNFENRQNIIRQLLRCSKQYQIQGINFDIENVNEEDGQLVTQLVKEAAPYFHAAGLIVSMDITFPSGDHNKWSSFYERSKLSQIADYLIVMAYDEHTSAVTGEGSVASLPWVESNLKNLLTEVPKEKLVLGVPLFSRLWKEQTNPDGSVHITSKAVSMDTAKSWLASKGIVPTYDKQSGQNYAQYSAPNEDTTYKIWLEDEMSLTKRVQLAEKYHLAGVASWSRNFGDQTAWTALTPETDKNMAKK